MRKISLLITLSMTLMGCVNGPQINGQQIKDLGPIKDIASESNLEICADSFDDTPSYVDQRKAAKDLIEKKNIRCNVNKAYKLMLSRHEFKSTPQAGLISCYGFGAQTVCIPE